GRLSLTVLARHTRWMAWKYAGPVQDQGRHHGCRRQTPEARVGCPTGRRRLPSTGVRSSPFRPIGRISNAPCPARSCTLVSVTGGHRMLTCYGDEVRLPQSDLSYIGFRLAALDTLCQIDICQGLDDEDDVPLGYLVEVPFLAQVAPVVQVDLLVDVWRRHRE